MPTVPRRAARRVGQGVPCLVDPRHARARLGAAVRVVLLGEPPIDARDLVPRGVARNTEHGIRVDLGHDREVYARTLAILSRVITKRSRRGPVEQADPETTVRPPNPMAADVADAVRSAPAQIDGAELDAAILRFLRRFPNGTVDLAPLAEELGVEPFRIQLAVEALARRRMVVAPFIEPGTAGGATLTAVGLRWLIAREGGTPADTPVALKVARDRVRPGDEAARLPRAQVYGVRRS